MPSGWSEEEVRATVEDYFDMLLMGMRGESFAKSQHNKLLSSKLKGRSRGAIEFKHANISAVLDELGVPYIDGYKPRSNYQGMLRDVVVELAGVYQAELHKAASEGKLPEKVPVLGKDWKSVLVDAPKPSPVPAKAGEAPKAKGLKFNFSEQEARNRKLGRMGEEFALQFEIRRLEEQGRKDLAKKVEWVSEKDDTAGFDILSFDEAKVERFIEVKTTNYGRSFPFMISQNEVRFSAANVASYHLYRVFTFRSEPRLFFLDGDVRSHCQLTPRVYRASFGATA